MKVLISDLAQKKIILLLEFLEQNWSEKVKKDLNVLFQNKHLFIIKLTKKK